jgi:hypothetical protein
LDSDRRGREGRKEIELTGEIGSGESGTGVDGGVTPVVHDGDGEVDDVLQRTANSKAWSEASDSFRGEAGEWLEVTAASGSLLRRLCDAKRPVENYWEVR